MGKKMDSKSIAYCLQAISEAFPGRFTPSKQTASFWSKLLMDLDNDFGRAAVLQLCGECDFPPTISQIRMAAYNISRGETSSPSAWEAWERAVSGKSETDIEKRAIKLVGGSYAIRRSSNQEVIRSHFLKCYTELLDRSDKNACAISEVRRLAEVSKPKQISQESCQGNCEETISPTREELKKIMSKLNDSVKP